MGKNQGIPKLFTYPMDHEGAIDYIINRMRTELPENLGYHALLHTLDVIKSAQYIAEAENVEGEDMCLLLTAAAYHDCGFIYKYHGHEEAGKKIATTTLPGFDYTPQQLQLILNMIEATRVPQQAHTHLERVLCDADLDYLGRDSYDVISQKLLDELLMSGKEISKKEWLNIQIKFLEDHHFWTDYSKKHRAPQKADVLARLKKQADDLDVIAD